MNYHNKLFNYFLYQRFYYFIFYAISPKQMNNKSQHSYAIKILGKLVSCL